MVLLKFKVWVRDSLSALLRFLSRHYFYLLKKDDSDLIERLSLSSKLDVHGGCVNTICWSEENPNLILGGSDDQKLSITDAFTGNV